MTNLKKIQNVIIFISSVKYNEIHTAEEVNKMKKDKWTYLDYMIAACDEYGYNLYILSKNDVRYTYKDNVLNIDDKTTNTSFSLNETNTENTIIFQGQNNANLSVVFVALFKLLYKLGYYMINPINSIINASDKYLSSVILSKFNIPQPNYVIIGKDDIEDEDGVVLNDFYRKIHSIYPSHPNINDNHSNYKYVCKILNGSLGIGVFLCREEEILSILQTLITLDPKLFMLIQEYKKNTGDIRAHAFSFDGKKYDIIGVMKRNKIDGDFRSNVSLGADTESIELTPEQEQIILNTAKASGCKWVGVDLMECEGEKKSESVVIEYNSSPGVQGISEQLGKNMFTIVFDQINNNLNEDTSISAPKNLEDTTTTDTNPQEEKKTSLKEDKILETVQVNKDVVTEESNYAFDNILLFTGPKDDAQILLKEITKKSNVKLYKFNPETIKYNLNKDSIKIQDGKTEITIDGETISSKNTIVFSRVMPNVAEKLDDLYSRLISDKFLFFNPKHGVELAGDKFKSAELFKKHKISQPKYVLVDANDVIKEDVKLFNKLKDIYSDAETNKENKYVVKNPTGGQGIGVFCVDGSQILAVLQAYFDVAPDKELLVQEFMDADGGDFRVHVLNLKSGQHILAAMKRDKIEGDFRSNVSLGAKTEQIKLTKEQEELAINAAKAMNLLWVGVDIMPVKNNKVKNVVIECNSGAGVAGISNMLGKNLFNLMFEKITKEDLG